MTASAGADQKRRFAMKKIVFIVMLLLALGGSARAEIEETLPFQFSFDLSRFRILTIAADGFNLEETVEMSRIWQDMGALVDFAGPKKDLSGETGEAPAPGTAGPKLTVDQLLSEIEVSRYDLIYFAGGEGLGQLIKEHGAVVKALIEKALHKKIAVAAICHAPQVLSLSELVKGKRVTANGEEETNALRNAGAIVVDEVFVRDGMFLTGQWPFLRTFAFHVAEKLQFPDGNGPFQQYLAGRTDLEKAFDDVRSSREISGQKVADETLEKIFRSAFKTILLQPWGNYPPLFKVLNVSDEKTKEAIAKEIGAQLKLRYLANFGSEEKIDMHVRRCFLTPPALYFVFIDMKAIRGSDPQMKEMAFRAAVTRYGSALENISLTARSLGLGIGLLGYPPFLQFAEKSVRNVLGIPENMAFIDMFLIGHPLGSNPPAIGKPLSAMMTNGCMKRPEGAK
jgi:protease I